MKQDWEIAHKETCTEEPDKRKVKAGKKKRTEAGMKQQKSYLKESTNVALANRRSRAASVLKEVTAACNEGNKEEKNGNKEKKESKKSRQKNSKNAGEGARGSEVD